MNTRNLALRIPLLLVISGVFSVGTVFSQSMADLARQERAKKARSQGKVFTNDDVSTPEQSAAPKQETSAKEESATPKEETAATGDNAGEKKAEGDQTASKEGAKPAEKTEKSAVDMDKLEKDYREKFAKLRDNQAIEEKKLDVLQREMNLNQNQYYSDPNVALREQTFRAQLNQESQDIEAQKAVVEKAKQAIADLEEELRQKNLPSGWAR